MMENIKRLSGSTPLAYGHFVTTSRSNCSLTVWIKFDDCADGVVYVSRVISWL
jgi:hypothetical protein